MITLSPYKNWIHFNFRFFSVSFAKGKFTAGNEILNVWYIKNLRKLRLSIRWFEITICRRVRK